MGLLKKNPGFFILCFIALLVFAGAITLIVIESDQLSKLKQQFATTERQMKELLHADPVPTIENLQRSQKNALELKARLQSIRENLKRGSRLNISNDGVRVMSGIQKYISNYRRQVATHLDANGLAAPIQVPNDFAFGFKKYLYETNISESPFVPVLDKQRQILSYILNQLIAADPAGIQAVEREILEEKSVGDGGFRINQAVSARVPGAIDTLAFRVTFTGYTPVLRNFLNNLAQFDLPVVVRSVEVDRSSTNAQQQSVTTLEDIFISFGGAPSEIEAIAPKSNGTPVISETESSFTVTLEFIEIILPTHSEANPS